MGDNTGVQEYFRSQWGQDKYIYEHLISKKSGVFFEVGAHDGETLSNTFFFEKYLDWSGVLVEMQPRFFDAIKTNRRLAQVFNCGISNIDFQMLWLDAGDRSGLLRYFEHLGIEHLEEIYQAANPKPKFSLDWVRVRPAMEILREANISHIDYFSLDVEGGEIEVLKSLDFDSVTIDLFTIEDNFGGWAVHSAWLQPRGYVLLGRLGTDGFFAHSRLLDRIKSERGSDALETLRDLLIQIR